MSTVHRFAQYVDSAATQTRAPSRATVFNAALVCLGIAYALSWLELALATWLVPSGTAGPPLAVMVVSRFLIGGLYLCVALRLQWARWLTVAIGFASVAAVAPMLGAEWHTLPVAALASGSTLVCKLASALFLTSAGGRESQ